MLIQALNCGCVAWLTAAGASADVTALVVVILFVLLEFTLAGCRTEVSSNSFNI
jgi:hypothetical protein